MALGMLRQGNTGSEILQILDVIVADIVEQNDIALQKLNDAISAQSAVWLTVTPWGIDCYIVPHQFLTVSAVYVRISGWQLRAVIRRLVDAGVMAPPRI